MATQRPKAVAMSFADAAGNGDGLAGLDVEDTEGANHPLMSQSPKSGAMVTMTDR